MTEKLKFTPLEGSVIIDLNLKNTKITPLKAIDIALRILEKQKTKDLEVYFVPVYNAMIEMRAQSDDPEDDHYPDDPPEVA